MKAALFQEQWDCEFWLQDVVRDGLSQILRVLALVLVFVFALGTLSSSDWLDSNDRLRFFCNNKLLDKSLRTIGMKVGIACFWKDSLWIEGLLN